MKRAGGAEHVAECILAYLLERPEAEDSIDGIVEWWVMRQRIQLETARVKQALSKLVKQGLILQRRAAGSPIRYRLNKEKLREIIRLTSRVGKR